MKVCLISVIMLAICLFFSCEKDQYNSLNGDITLVGHAYVIDTLTNIPAVPIAGQKIYLNTGNDTSSYIFQTNTDSAGMFIIPSLNDGKTYIVFSKFIKNGIEYKGASRIEGGAVNKTINTSVNVYPNYFNGMSILFTDSIGGILPNLPFRIYNSRVAATFDSVQYAFANTTSDVNGYYNRFNINPVKFYVVSSATIGTLSLKIFDSVTVSSAGIKKDTMLLK